MSYIEWQVRQQTKGASIKTLLEWFGANQMDMTILLEHLAERQILSNQNQHEWVLLQQE